MLCDFSKKCHIIQAQIQEFMLGGAYCIVLVRDSTGTAYVPRKSKVPSQSVLAVCSYLTYKFDQLC